MEENRIKQAIKKAIDSNKTLDLTIKHGVGDTIEISLDPYILGSDTMQYDFVWGYIPFNKLYYKLILDFILSARVSEKKFEVQNDAVYLFALEEEHFEIVGGFDNIYGQGLVERKNKQ
jgi:hypothetical protein